MQKKSVRKKILYSIAGFVLVALVAIGIFLKFYFEDALNKYAIPRLTEAARVATHGKYHLKLGRISYSGGEIFCKNFILQRTGYDSSEHGNTVKQISMDSVLFTGVSWWAAIWGDEMRMTSLQMSQPKIYFTNIEKERETLKDLPNDTFANSAATPKNLPVISFDSIVLRDVSIYLPERSHRGGLPSFEKIELKLTKFLLDSKTLIAQPLLYSERVDFSMRKASYPLDDSDYSIEFRNIRGSFSDSLLAIDTFAYHPRYSKEVFATRHKYVQPRLDFKCFDIHVHAINFVDLIGGTSVTFRTCSANSWSLDFFSDRRLPNDPHPPNATLPNDLVRSIDMPINVDSIIFNHGSILWSERWPGMVPGTLTFSNARIAAYPFCTDTLNPRCSAATKIAVNALFLGEAQVNGLLTYSLHNKAADFSIDATVGSFSAKKLNTELIPIERLEVTDGTVNRGIIRMNVRNGIAITMVMPEYHDLSIKVLAKGATESRGIMEGIKTFIANSFALRTNNLGHGENKPFTATTTLRRTKDQEFLQFAWLALRKSLGKVVGFK